MRIDDRNTDSIIFKLDSFINGLSSKDCIVLVLLVGVFTQILWVSIYLIFKKIRKRRLARDDSRNGEVFTVFDPPHMYSSRICK